MRSVRYIEKSRRHAITCAYIGLLSNARVMRLSSPTQSQCLIDPSYIKSGRDVWKGQKKSLRFFTELETAVLQAAQSVSSARVNQLQHPPSISSRRVPFTLPVSTTITITITCHITKQTETTQRGGIISPLKVN